MNEEFARAEARVAAERQKSVEELKQLKAHLRGGAMADCRDALYPYFDYNNGFSGPYLVYLIMDYHGLPFYMCDPTSAFKADDDYLCPISGNLIITPVILETGHVFEKTNIMTWFKEFEAKTTSRRCPVTNLAVSGQLIEPKALKRQYEKYRLDNHVVDRQAIVSAIRNRDITFFFRTAFLEEDIDESLFELTMRETGNMEMIRFMMHTWNFKITRAQFDSFPNIGFRLKLHRANLIPSVWILDSLHKAVDTGTIDVARTLISRGVDVHQIHNGRHLFQSIRTKEMFEAILGACKQSKQDVSPTKHVDGRGIPIGFLAYSKAMSDFWISRLLVNSVFSVGEILSGVCANPQKAVVVFANAFVNGDACLLQKIVDTCTKCNTYLKLVERVLLPFSDSNGAQYSNLLEYFVCVSVADVFNPAAFHILKTIVGENSFCAMILTDGLLRKCDKRPGMARYFMSGGAKLERNEYHYGYDAVDVKVLTGIIQLQTDELRQKDLRIAELDSKTAMTDEPVSRRKTKTKMNSKSKRKVSTKKGGYSDHEDSDPDFKPPSSVKKMKVTPPAPSLSSSSFSSSSAAAAAAASSSAIDVSDDE